MCFTYSTEASGRVLFPLDLGTPGQLATMIRRTFHCTVEQHGGTEINVLCECACVLPTHGPVNQPARSLDKKRESNPLAFLGNTTTQNPSYKYAAITTNTLITYRHTQAYFTPPSSFLNGLPRRGSNTAVCSRPPAYLPRTPTGTTHTPLFWLSRPECH